MNNKILIVDDEIDFLNSLVRGLRTAGFKHIIPESNPDMAAQLVQQVTDIDVALIDITMPEMSGIELLDIIRGRSPKTECLMVTAIDEARVAVECLGKGAYDYLVKPISKEDLIITIKRALERKRLMDLLHIGKRRTAPPLNNPTAFSNIVTNSTTIFKILKEAELHAQSDLPILISGETGTGKELLARAIHQSSARNNAQFTPINVDSIDPSMFSAEFFGHVKGAYTGASRDRKGYLEVTHRGTLFLDEIGNLPLDLQGKLLRVLQDGEFMKLGKSHPQKVDARIVAATNADLERMLAQKKFRKDLFYRLQGGWLHLPPLRERKEDIPVLISWFVKKYSAPDKEQPIDDDAMKRFMAYDYPGNIRELEAMVQYALNLCQGRPITLACLPKQLALVKLQQPSFRKLTKKQIIPLEKMEKNHILSAYRYTQRNKSKTARLLGISLSTLRRKLEAYGRT
jgi:DNA-binding NtrC family response regulator